MTVIGFVAVGEEHELASPSGRSRPSFAVEAVRQLRRGDAHAAGAVRAAAQHVVDQAFWSSMIGVSVRHHHHGGDAACRRRARRADLNVSLCSAPGSPMVTRMSMRFGAMWRPSASIISAPSARWRRAPMSRIFSSKRIAPSSTLSWRRVDQLGVLDQDWLGHALSVSSGRR